MTEPMPEMIDFDAPLSGYWWEDSNVVCIPAIFNTGNPHAFLSWLSSAEAKGKRVQFPCVINGRLAELLTKRGYTYTPRLAFAEEFGEWVDGFYRDHAVPDLDTPYAATEPDEDDRYEAEYETAAEEHGGWR